MAFEDIDASDSEYCVYHERQLNDSNLCAVHCVNNLLQYPFFDVQTCEHYVQQLKEKEAQMLMTDADPDFVVHVCLFIFDWFECAVCSFGSRN